MKDDRWIIIFILVWKLIIIHFPIIWKSWVNKKKKGGDSFWNFPLFIHGSYYPWRNDGTPFTELILSRVCPWRVPSTYFPLSTWKSKRGQARWQDILQEPPWEFVATQFANAFRKRFLYWAYSSSRRREGGGQWSFSLSMLGRWHHRYLLDDNVNSVKYNAISPPYMKKILSLYYFFYVVV